MFYSNRAVQPWKMARGLKFLILEVDCLYYLCSENNGADQLPGYRSAPLFSHIKNRFSHDIAQL